MYHPPSPTITRIPPPTSQSARGGGGWRASDATIAALMESLGAGGGEDELSRSLQRLRDHGVLPERKIFPQTERLQLDFQMM